MSKKELLEQKNIDAWLKNLGEVPPPHRFASESKIFCDLVYDVLGTSDPRVVRALFLTLTDEDSGGVLESVYTVLGSVNVDLYFYIYAEIAPNLIANAPKCAVNCLSYYGYTLSEFEVDTAARRIQCTVDAASLQKFTNVISQIGAAEDYPISRFFKHFSLKT
jgi:hypothetical protein